MVGIICFVGLVGVGSYLFGESCECGGCCGRGGSYGPVDLVGLVVIVGLLTVRTKLRDLSNHT